MRLRMLLLSSAITVGGLAGFAAPASADCYGQVNSCGNNGMCAADSSGNWAVANACSGASECHGNVNYCPNARGNKCSGTVNVCGTKVTGFTCGFASVTDPQNQGNQTGEVDSHFLVVNTGTANPAHGRVTCRFQTGSTYTAPGTVLATVTSPEQNTYVDLTSTVSYPEPAGDVYLCTYWYAGDSTVPASGDTEYRADDTTGELVEADDATGAETCALATSQDTSPVDALLCGVFETVESVVPAVGETLEDTWGCPEDGS